MVLSVAMEKIPSDTIDPETVRLVGQCLNHYATPGPCADVSLNEIHVTISSNTCNTILHLNPLNSAGDEANAETWPPHHYLT